MSAPGREPRYRNSRLAFRNSAFSLLSLGCRLIGNMVVFIVIARIPGIGTEDFGQLTYAVALGSLFVLASQFGLVPLVIRDIAADATLLEPRARATITMRVLLSALGVAAVLLYVWSVDMSPQGRSVCLIMIAALYVGSFSTDLQALFQGREKMHLEVVGVVAENVLLLALAMAAFLFQATIVHIAWGFLAAKSVALVLNYVVCGRFLFWVVPGIDPAQWKRMMPAATPFALAGIIAAGVVQLDTVLLRELIGAGSDGEVGIYQAAVRLFLIPMLLPEIVLKVFLPQLSRMHGRSGEGLVRDLGRVNHILLTMGVLIGLVTFFRGNDIIRLFYGNRYADAGPVLQLLGITVMLRFGAAYNLYFTIRDRVWFRVWSALLALVAVVVFDFLLIPRYGAIGAAYASILSNAVYWIPYLVALYLAEGTMALGWNLFRAGIAAGAAVLVLRTTAGIEVMIMLPVYFLLGLLAVFLTMPSDDRSRIITQFRVRGA